MKKIVVVLCLLSFAWMVGAEETGAPVYTSPNGRYTRTANALNTQEYLTHSHSYIVPDYERDDELGVKAEIVVWENEDYEGLVQEVRIDPSYDFANEETAVYAVVKINLFRKIAR